MKILNAIHAQSIGGVDQMFRNYSKALSKKHEVSLLIFDNGNDNYNNLHFNCSAIYLWNTCNYRRIETL